MHAKRMDNKRVTPFLDGVRSEVYETSFSDETDFEPESHLFASDYESPFSFTSESQSDISSSSPESEEFVSFLAELEDSEFDEELYGFINELTLFAENEMQYSNRFNGSRQQHQILELQIEPLSREIDHWIDELANRLDNENLETITENELEAIFRELDIASESFAPSTEYFGGFIKKIGRGIKNKVKKTVKSVVNKAKKGVVGLAKKAGGALKTLGLKFLWPKLKRVAKSLLKRVVHKAINKLPSQYRPIARMLAKRFIKEVDEEIYTFKGKEQPVSDVKYIQKELDLQLANLVFVTNETEQELILSEYEITVDKMVQDTASDLDTARMRFVQRLNELEEHEDPTPAVEEFVPAIMMAIRLGIKLIGRPKVVNFLAKYLAKLIKRWVGKRWATPLSRAIVDAGMRLVNLETEEDEAVLAGDAVAATLEETIQNLVSLDDYILDNEALLEGFILEAFENAASSNLPPVLSEKVYRKRPKLRQSSRLKGVWVLHPRRGYKRRFKKYTRIINREITPHMAEMVRTWRGMPLSTYFKRRYGIYGRPVQVRIHSYEAIPGTMLSLITENEADVMGMSQAHPESFHPLTYEAAGVLLDEPGLGREASEEFLAEPYHTAVGQRFYYLEVLNETPAISYELSAPQATPPCCDTHLFLDFVKQQIRVAVFLDESNAQEIAQRIRQGSRNNLLIANLRNSYVKGLQRALASGANHQTKIIHTAVSPLTETSDLLSWIPPILLKDFERKLVEALDSSLLSELPKQASRFVAEADAPELGITLKFVCGSLAELSNIGQIFAGEPTRLRQVIPTVALPSIQMDILAGYWRG